jgi:hypothetical protein
VLPQWECQGITVLTITFLFNMYLMPVRTLPKVLCASIIVVITFMVAWLLYAVTENNTMSS